MIRKAGFSVAAAVIIVLGLGTSSEYGLARSKLDRETT